MKMLPVSSTNILEIGHDPITDVLAVKFKDGGIYHYEGVDSKAAHSLTSAKSVGSHFHAHIKGKHQHTRKDRQ